MCNIVCSYMYIAACNNSFKLLDMTSDLASKEESSNVDTSQVMQLKSHTSKHGALAFANERDARYAG